MYKRDLENQASYPTFLYALLQIISLAIANNIIFSTNAGFLSTGDYHSPGNYGLMDMALALEWVYNNIRFFNGDRERITVFGPDAGGAAAGLLAVLPKTRDWVQQVIAEVVYAYFLTFKRLSSKVKIDEAMLTGI